LPVQLPNHGAHVGLQEARADHDQSQAKIEGQGQRERQGVVAGGNHQSAVEHGFPLAHHAVGNPSPWQGDEVTHPRIHAVDRARLDNVEAQAASFQRCRHEENQQGAHAVVAEALPVLGEEESCEPARVTEKSCHERRASPQITQISQISKAKKTNCPLGFSTPVPAEQRKRPLPSESRISLWKTRRAVGVSCSLSA